MSCRRSCTAAGRWGDRQPAWRNHLAALREVGVHLVYGEGVWPLYEPRQAPPGRGLPWEAILQLTGEIIDGGSTRE